jgi:uncharacterized protein YndB with AHSA1/START domain
MSPTGLTRDAGWQIGVSRTLPVPLDAAWDFLISPDGLRLWLGEVGDPLAKGADYATEDGTTGEVRSLHPRDRVRLTWKPPGRELPATVQVTVRPGRRGTTVNFHTERLASESERERFRGRWREALDRIEARLA